LWTNMLIVFMGDAIDQYGRRSSGLEVGVRVLAGSRIFSSPCVPDRLWDPPNLPIQWALGALFLGVKRAEREADHSPPTSVEVKKTWICTSTPPHAFMA
jgi:hypothetical protein